MKFMMSVFLLTMNACVLIPNNPSNEQSTLPNLYDQDYGTIQYVDNYNQQRSVLNKFWAQEAIGTPEARELIKEMQRNNFRFSSPQLAIADNGFDLRKNGHPRFSKALNNAIQSNYEDKIVPRMKSISSENLEHGTRTLGMIVGKEPVGVSSLGEVDDLHHFESRPVFADFAEAADKNKQIPDIINASKGYSWFKYDDLPGGGRRAVPATPVDPKMLSDAMKVMEKTIFVNSAGNNFPQPIDYFKDELGNKMILVGSADPGGFPSKFSQVSEHVVVLAPSDHFLQSIDADGKIVKFGGTSGAAPMVSGVLADVKAILPGLTRDEAVHMLKKTATHTPLSTMSARSTVRGS